MPLSLSVSQAAPNTLDTPLLVVALGADPSLPDSLGALDASLGGTIGRAVSRRDFRGGRDETLHLAGAANGPKRVLLLGLGKPTERTGAIRRAGAIAARQGAKMGVGDLAFYAGSLSAPEVEAGTEELRRRFAVRATDPDLARLLLDEATCEWLTGRSGRGFHYEIVHDRVLAYGWRRYLGGRGPLRAAVGLAESLS